MTSPAKRHFERMRAAKLAARHEPGQSLAGASHYELMLAKLATDKRRLKSIQSIARKIDVKREVLPEYSAYVAGSLEGGRGAQDDVLMTVMIWRIDTGDYAGALNIARYALRHRLTLPDQYQRGVEAALAEEFADAALATLRDGGTFDVEQLTEVLDLTAAADMHDQIRAKLHKAIGSAAMKLVANDQLDDVQDYARAAQAVQNFEAALKFDERAGVKQTMNRLNTALFDADCRRQAARA